jgi:hypothetical protein
MNNKISVQYALDIDILDSENEHEAIRGAICIQYGFFGLWKRKRGKVDKIGSFYNFYLTHVVQTLKVYWLHFYKCTRRLKIFVQT